VNVNENGSNNGNHQSKIEIDIKGVCRKGRQSRCDFVLRQSARNSGRDSQQMNCRIDLSEALGEGA